MINTLNMPAHERLRLLRNGEKVLCKKCKKGTMLPVGNREKTNTFYCDFCKKTVHYQLIRRRLENAPKRCGFFVNAAYFSAFTKKAVSIRKPLMSR